MSQLTNQVAAQLPGGKFTRSNLSHYRSGRSFPRQDVLEALSKVLEVPMEELIAGPELQARATLKSESAPAAPALRIEDVGDGEVVIQINQSLAWPAALKVLQALRPADFAGLRVEDTGGGEVFIRINQRSPWPDALRVMQALRPSDFARPLNDNH